MSDTICSADFDEPLPGTAKAGKLFIALEHHYGWSHDILDGGVYGDDITARLKSWLAERNGSLQLIRKPGRLGQVPCDGINLYISHCDPSEFATSEASTAATASDVFVEHRMVADVEELMTLDIQLGKRTEGAALVDKPMLLVCTHGKRDRCCAVKGRPLAAALAQVFPEQVWETSHSKGHRFAPAVVMLPWNYSYGRLSAQAMKDALDAAEQGTLYADGCRGRGIYKAQGQVAELAAREALGEWSLDAVESVQVADAGTGTAIATVSLYDGRAIEVALEQIVTDGVVSSCGDEPGPKKGWAAVGVRQLG